MGVTGRIDLALAYTVVVKNACGPELKYRVEIYTNEVPAR